MSVTAFGMCISSKVKIKLTLINMLFYSECHLISEVKIIIPILQMRTETQKKFSNLPNGKQD